MFKENLFILVNLFGVKETGRQKHGRKEGQMGAVFNVCDLHKNFKMFLRSGATETTGLARLPKNRLLPQFFYALKHLSQKTQTV